MSHKNTEDLLGTLAELSAEMTPADFKEMFGDAIYGHIWSKFVSLHHNLLSLYQQLDQGNRAKLVSYIDGLGGCEPPEEEIVLKVFRFNKLEESVQEKLVEKRRQSEAQDDWWVDDEVEDIVEAMNIMGFEIEKPRGRKSGWPVWFDTYRGNFGVKGRYSYAKGAVKRLKDERPTDTALHEAAQALQDAQKKHFYKLSAKLTDRYSPEIFHSDYYYPWDGDDGDMQSAIEDVYNWGLGRLRLQEEWMSSDENALECLMDGDDWYFADGTEAPHGPEED